MTPVHLKPSTYWAGCWWPWWGRRGGGHTQCRGGSASPDTTDRRRPGGCWTWTVSLMSGMSSTTPLTVLWRLSAASRASWRWRQWWRPAGTTTSWRGWRASQTPHRTSTTQIWETLTSTYRDKYGVSGLLQGKVVGGLVKLGWHMLLALHCLLWFCSHHIFTNNLCTLGCLSNLSCASSPSWPLGALGVEASEAAPWAPGRCRRWTSRPGTPSSPPRCPHSRPRSCRAGHRPPPRPRIHRI